MTACRRFNLVTAVQGQISGATFWTPCEVVEVRPVNGDRTIVVGYDIHGKSVLDEDPRRVFRFDLPFAVQIEDRQTDYCVFNHDHRFSLELVPQDGHFISEYTFSDEGRLSRPAIRLLADKQKQERLQVHYEDIRDRHSGKKLGETVALIVDHIQHDLSQINSRLEAVQRNAQGVQHDQ